MVLDGGSVDRYRISRSIDLSNASFRQLHPGTPECSGSHWRPPIVSSSTPTTAMGLAPRDNVNRQEIVHEPETEIPHIIASRTHASASASDYPASNDRIVASLSPAVKVEEDTTALKQPYCVGILSDAVGKRFRICLHNGRTLNQCSTLISLRDLIIKSHPPTKQLQLILAVILASSVMQLHGTGWLKEFWSSEDIFFEVGNDFGHVSLDQPFVREMFNVPYDGDTTMGDANRDDGAPAIVRFANRELFSLGIILIELHHWRLIEELRGQRAEHIVVDELVEDLGEQAGLNYQSAVQRCIQGLGHEDRKLELEDFKKEIYQKVVAVLAADLECFC